MANHLEELILAGKIDDALAHVSTMSTTYIGSLLDLETLEPAAENLDLFIRGLYNAADSPYATAEIDYDLGGLYIISPLCYLDDWEFTARDLSLNALAGLAKRMADDIAELDLLVGAPDSAISKVTHTRLMGYAEQLRAMNFQPTAQEQAVHEEHVRRDFDEIGGNTAEWVERYRHNRFTHSGTESGSPSVAASPTRRRFWPRFPSSKRQ